ncbi:MAG TPA: PAS domain S-box protein [Anaerolineales bacterium]|nr:PAS domain S-box protein [Anaerolineales bacterium]
MSTGLPSSSRASGDRVDKEFQEFFWQNPLPMWVYDLESLEFLAVNEAALEYFGYTLNEFLSLHVADIRPEKNDGRSPSREQYERKDGKVIEVETISRTMRFQDREVALVVTVSAQRSSPLGLDQGEAQLSTLIATTMDAVITIDEDQRIILFNRAAETIFGYPVARVIGQRLDVLVPARFHTSHRSFVEVFGREQLTKRRMGRVDAVEITGLRANGEEFLAEVSISRFESGGKRFYTAILRDVAERKRTEAALLESEKRYRTLAEAAHDMIFILDRQGRVQYVNSYAAQQFRNEPSQLVGKRITELFPSEVVSRQMNSVKSVIETGQSVYVEAENHFPERASWLGTRLVPMRTETGEVYAVLGIARDISDRKKAEVTLQRHDAVLEAVSFAAERFLKAGDWEQNVQEFLAYLGQATGTSRVYVFENSIAQDGSLLTHYRYEWVTSGVTPQLDNPLLQNFPYQEGGLGRWEAMLGRNQAVYGNVKDFPESEKVILIPQDIRSLAVVPIFVSGIFWGHMGYDECAVEREWSAMEIEALRTAANILGAAIQNQHAKEALRASEAEYRSLFENALEGIYRTTPDGKILTGNPAMVEMFGYASLEEMQGIQIAHDLYVYSEDREEMNRRLDENGEIHNAELLLRRKDGHPLIVLDNSRAVRDEDGKILYYEGTLTDITGRKRAEQQIQRKMEQLSSLHTIDLAISSSTDLGITLNIVLGHVLTQLNVDAAGILLLNPYSLTLQHAFGQGFRSSKQAHLSLRLGEGQAGRAALERRIIFLPDLVANLGSFKAEFLEGEDFVPYVCIPLTAKGEVKGVLEIFNRTSLNPDDAWFDFLQLLAGQTAIAIDNNSLFNNLQRSNMELILAYNATIEGWSRALELRDRETKGHTSRVTNMAVELAHSLGLNDSEITQIRHGALLHDIGKMGVPDDILHKPGPLTEEEWEIMRRHPQFAYEMLRPIDYLRSALDIPYCHHEKWDGTGYPRGLAGEGIPLAARLFAVIDVYDALTSNRPYRKAWTKARSLAYVRKQAGKHFDPRVVDVFLNTVSKLEE